MRHDDLTQERAGIYRLFDVVAEKWTKVHEYPNDRVAVYACSTLELPPYTQSGDYVCYRVGWRQGNNLDTCEPVAVWTYEVKDEKGKVS